jgi:hypothetical protein
MNTPVTASVPFPEAPTKRACGNPKCSTSTGIHDDGHSTLSGLTFGSGKLDGFGYWSKPCYFCARDFEQRYPEAAPCWPFSEQYLAELDERRKQERPVNVKCTRCEFVALDSPDSQDVLNKHMISTHLNE